MGFTCRYLGEQPAPDGSGVPCDVFAYRCRWCSFHGIVGAAIGRRHWPWQCPGCSRKYDHFHPLDAALPVPAPP